MDSDNFSDISNQTTLTTSTLGKLTGIASGTQAVEAVDQLFGGVFDTLNNVVLKSFTENQVLTREEFIQTVSATGKIFCFLAVLIFVASFLQVGLHSCADLLISMLITISVTRRSSAGNGLP